MRQDGWLVSSDFKALPGFVEAPGRDAGIAAHYGNPLVEQRSLADGRAIVDLSNRAVIAVSGQDRLSWVDSMTSQSIGRMTPGDSAETLLLDQNGRLESAVKLIDDGDTLWMLLEAPEAPFLLAWLTRMRFLLRVEVRERTDEFATIGAMGDPSFAAASPNGVPLVWRDPWPKVAPGGHQYATGDHPAGQWEWTETLVPRADLEEIASRFPVAGFLATEALRIAAWRPRFATEVDERSIPHELDWLRSAVSLEKGCYRGQETVAKVHNLGHPPRRLVLLHLDGSDSVLPAPGDEVRLRGIPVGRLTSSAMHFELGPIALAVLKRTTDEGATLTVHAGDTDIAASQEVIVPANAGAVANVPRIPRLGAVRR